MDNRYANSIAITAKNRRTGYTSSLHFWTLVLPPLTILAMLWLWPIPAYADGPTFTTSSDYGVCCPDDVLLRDMDGDGDLDILAGYNEAQNLVYLNDGYGNFPNINTINENNTRPFGPGTDKTRTVAVADLNGDGHLDIVVGNSDYSSGEQNVVYLNDGFGNFPTNLTDSNARLLGPGTDITTSVAVGDINGDGHLDIVVGNSDYSSGEQNVVYLNDGMGNFPSGIARTIGTEVYDTSDVAIGDVDRDSDLDIIIINQFGGVQLVYLNDGLGNFTDSDTRVFWLDNAAVVAMGDVDGDGHLDMATADQFRAPTLVHQNDGTGNFPTSTSLVAETGAQSIKTTSVVMGDMDGDGDLDIVTGTIGGNGAPNVIYLNDGQGNFSGNTIQTFGPKTDNTRVVTVGDVNGDGDLDIVTGAIGGNGAPNVIYLNDGTGNLYDSNPQAITEEIIGQTTTMAVGDMNGDGHLDVIMGNFLGSNHLIFLNDGQGNFSDSDTKAFGTVNENTASVAVGDVDGDGDLDIVVGNISIRRNSSIRNGIWFNDGAGDFTTVVEQSFSLDRYNTYSVILGDMDGDGDLDIVTGNGNSSYAQDPFGISNQNVIYLNDGIVQYPNYSEFLMTRRYFGTGDDDTDSLAIGDMDGDGNLDIVTGNWQEQNVVYLNDGAGNFPSDARRNFGTGTDATTALAIGDLDGDGDLDIVAGNRGQNRIYLNDGAGNLPMNSSRQFGTGADGTENLALADVDSDGDLDIVTANGTGIDTDLTFPEQNVIYLNDGAGNFSNSHTQNLGRLERDTYGLAVGDLDGDGDLDIVTGNGFAGGSWGLNRLYQNHIQQPNRLTNTPPFLTATRPVTTGNANFYSSPVLVDSHIIPISYTLFDAEGDTVGRIAAFFSMDGGDNWQPAIATADTITTNVPTGRFIDYASSASAQPIPDTGSPFSINLQITESHEIAELDVWLTITHTNNADLDIALQSPAGTIVPLVTTDRASGQNFRGTRFSDRAITTIISGTAPYTGTYRPEGDLLNFQGQTSNGSWALVITDSAGGGSGSLVGWGLRIKTPLTTQVYYWDTFASGLFGQSDNIVIRLVAYPQPPTGLITHTYRYSNTVAGPYQWPYAAATTFPFRVQGARVQVISGTMPISNAIVYRLPGGQPTGGFALGNTITTPFRTNHQGYLTGRGEIGRGDRLLALLPIQSALTYEGALEFDGLDDYAVKDPLSNVPSSEITIAFWLRADDSTGNGTLLSYSTPGEPDALRLANPNNLTVYRGGEFVTTGVTATVGLWQHFAVTWQGSDGAVTVYRDGEAVYTGTLAARTSLPPDGALWLGRDQAGGDFFTGALDEVRLWNVTRAEAEIQDDMTWPFSDDEPGQAAYWPFNDNSQRTAFDKTGHGNDLTLQGARWIGESLGGYTVYYTSGRPVEDGVDTFTVTEPGVQVLTATAQYPLIHFDLDLTLEWDASQDPSYLEQLAFDLKKASEHLYDFTDGQAALGKVNVFQNADHWLTSHVVVHATNRLRPLAIQGGIVTEPTADPERPDILYDTGQVRMGATWNRYGDPGQSGVSDWAVTLAHELAHYFLYLDDVYLGFDEEGLLIPVDTCTGSAMGDVYDPDNTEFIADEAFWASHCQRSLAHQTLGRTEWETIRLWYPDLSPPAAENPGPSLMPFNFTTITVHPPLSPTNTLADPTFFLDYVDQMVASSTAQAFLLREQDPQKPGYDYVINLGSPLGGQNRLLARGARPGDRLCLFDPSQHQYGCEVVEATDERVQLERDEAWTPVIQLSPVTSRTFSLQVSGLAENLTLQARLYPEFGFGSEIITLAEETGVYSGTFNLAAPSMSGHIQVWVASDEATEFNPRREAMVSYVIGGNPGGVWPASRGDWPASRGDWPASRGDWPASRGAWPASRGDWPASRGSGAPLVSTDGQMILFIDDTIAFDDGVLYTVQNLASLPPLPAGEKPLGPGYNLFASPGAPDIPGSISFQYLSIDALVEQVDEASLTIHFWDGAMWRPLDTVRSTYYNLASAPSQGSGIYALLAGVTKPAITTLTPVAATNEVTTTLALSGSGFLKPLSLHLVGPSQTYVLPILEQSYYTVTGVISAGKPAGPYQVAVANGDGATSPQPALFGLYEPNPSGVCFRERFESGPSWWGRNGEWAIVTLPSGEQAMTDSPAGNYDSAVPPALSYTTAITSPPFSLAECPDPVLSFRHDYVIASLGESQDVGRVEISTDEGATWQEVAHFSGGGLYEELPRQVQDVGPLEWTEVEWKEEQIGLNLSVGSLNLPASGTVRLRFSLTVDQDVSDKGWVIDEIVVKSASADPGEGATIYLPLIFR